MTNAPQQQNQQTAIVEKRKQQVASVRTLLNSMKDQLLAALPKHIPIESYLRATLTLVQKNPGLLDCDQHSFLGAVMEAAQMGLVLGREAHLVPFRNKRRGITEVQMISDYKGLIKLCEQSGHVSYFNADVVRVGDIFEQTTEGILHAKKVDQGEVKKIGNIEYVLPKPKQPICNVYALAVRKDGHRQYVVLDMQEIEEARNRSKQPNGVWLEHPIEMMKKTAVRKLCKMIPQSPNLLRMSQLEGLADEDRSQGLRANVDKEYLPDFEHTDATTIVQINQEGAAENEKDKAADLLGRCKDQVKKLVDIGYKEPEVLAKLELKSLTELDKMDSATLDATLDVLLDLESR